MATLPEVTICPLPYYKVPFSAKEEVADRGKSKQTILLNGLEYHLKTLECNRYMWRELISCSAADEPYDHIWLCH